MTIETETLKVLVQQLNESGGNKVTSNLAAWLNRDAKGKFLTVEICPRYARTQRPPSLGNKLEQFFAMKTTTEKLAFRRYLPINIFGMTNRRSHSGRRKLEKK